MYKINTLATIGEPLGYKYTINLDRDITDPEDFREEILVIRNSGEGDVVHILISSGGGQVETMKTILSAISQTKAHVITEITGDIASAATFIFLAGDEYLVSDDANMMCHSVSFGSGGKANDVKRHVDFTHDMGRRLVYKYYEGFFSEDEMEELLRGEEFWLTASEIMERLSVRNKTLEKSMSLDYSEEDLESIYDQMKTQLEDYANTFGITYQEMLEKISPDGKETTLDDSPYSTPTELKEGQYEEDGVIYEELGSIDTDLLLTTPSISQLQEYADLLEIKYAPNIGVEKLRERIVSSLGLYS